MKKFQCKKYIVQLTFLAAVFASTTGASLGRGAGEPGKVALKVAELVQVNANFRETKLFSVAATQTNEQVSNTINNYTLLQVNISALKGLLQSQPEYIRVTVPAYGVNASTQLLLYKFDISGNGFSLETSDGRKFKELNKIVHYRGIIENDMNSVVSFSFSEEETMGLISSNEGNFVLGELENNNQNEYVYYNDKDLVPSFTYDCGTNTSNLVNQYQQQQNTNTPGLLTTNCVDWYYETDYDIFVGKGSLANVNSYIQGVFNQVSTLYNNDGVSITLQTLFVWTTTDPYTGPSTSDYLNQFGVNRTSFAGDLANLVGYNGGGGVAYVNGLCGATQYKMGYMGISASFNTVPTYSWTVEVVTHEDGHLLGSRHTHDCVWNGNSTAIDGCGDAAGYNGSGTCATGPLPSSGTIMSYCHLVSGVGINFNNGFGSQPLAVILNSVNTSSCLAACSACQPPSQPATITGQTSYCLPASQTYSVTAVSGATSYLWSLPTGWTGSSTSNSITVTQGTTGGTVSVTAVNSCGNSPVRTLTVTGNATPSQPGNLLGNTTACQGTSQTYSISAVSGATSYIWTLPSGWTGTSTGVSITATAGASGGTVSVAASNSCGTSAARTITVSVNALPAQPGTISAPGGVGKVCPGSVISYYITSVIGATSYNWIPPVGSTLTGGQGTASVTVSYNSGFVAADTIKVIAVNGCGNSLIRARKIDRNTPVRPGAISGGATNVCNGSNIPYSVTNVAGITYNWYFSAASASVNSGQGTNSIAASFTPNYITGTLNVTASNACGTSTARTLTVAATPAQPAAIIGTISPCSGQQGVSYSTTPVAGALSYTWNVPSGAQINDGTVTSTTATLVTSATAVTVNFASTAGYVRVKATNSCGSGIYRSLIVAFGCRLDDANVTSAFHTTIFPNPASEQIYVQFESGSVTTESIKITDVTGKTFFLQSGKSVEGNNEVTIDINHLAPGIYFLEVMNGEEKNISKISVE